MNIKKMSRKIFVLSTVCLVNSCLLFAQNNTSSPLTIFGIGEVEYRDFGSTAGLGNAGIGLKSRNFLNRRNPAGLSGTDTLAFIFDISTAVKMSRFSTVSSNSRSANFNFKNLAAGFRISKRWATGIGLSPYSNVGYSIAMQQQIEGTDEIFNTLYSGNGGVNRFYWGNSVELFRGFSVGATASYFFGTVTHTDQARTLSVEETMTANKFYFDFGVQYSHLFKQHTYVTVGGVYGYQSNFNLYRHRIVSYNTDWKEETVPDKKMKLPESYGVGFSVRRNKRDYEWLFAADYYRQNWSVNTDRLIGIAYSDSRMYNAGFQLIPNTKRPENYLQIMRYQVGACYNESYMTINGYPLKDYSVSAGVGLPFFISRSSSYVNVAVTVGQSGTRHRGGITENYVLLSVNLSLMEAWFAKQKLD
ncbi:MAG: hypothetical protein LBS09_07860 [Bacteroidales bacterium]|jgi:hypothetical protein|nr:hypothetical protein [Bacteroidales bacterium]